MNFLEAFATCMWLEDPDQRILYASIGHRWDMMGHHGSLTGLFGSYPQLQS
jgi:hypothetical protein